MDNRLLSSISQSHHVQSPAFTPSYFNPHRDYLWYLRCRDEQHQHKQEYIPSLRQFQRDFLRSSISRLTSKHHILNATYLRLYMEGDHIPGMTLAIYQQLLRNSPSLSLPLLTVHEMQLRSSSRSAYIPAQFSVEPHKCPNPPNSFPSNHQENTAACLTTHPTLSLQHQHLNHQDLLLLHSNVQSRLTQLEDYTIPTLQHAIDRIPPLSASPPSPDDVTHLHIDYIPPLSAPHPSPDDVTHLHFELSDLQDTLTPPPVLTNLLPPLLPPIKSNCYRINLPPPLLANRPNKPPTCLLPPKSNLKMTTRYIRLHPPIFAALRMLLPTIFPTNAPPTKPTFTKISLPILHPLLLLLPIFSVLQTFKPLTFHHESPD